MDCLDVLKNRRTCRKFLNKDIEDSLIYEIIDYARYAPSSGNLQNWNFIVIKNQKDKNTIAKLSLSQLWMTHASAMIVVCVDPSKTEKYYGNLGEKYSIINGVFATSNILLAAESLGVKTAYVGAFDKYKLKETLRIPDNIEVIGIICLGFSNENIQLPAKFPLKNQVYITNWKQEFDDPKFSKFGRTSHIVERNVNETKKLLHEHMVKGYNYIKNKFTGKKNENIDVPKPSNDSEKR